MFWPEYLYPNPNRKPVTPQRRKQLLFSYAPDWIITVFLWIALYLIDKITGFWREFSLTDTSIQHTYTLHERVPVWALGLICLAPIVFYVAIGWGIMRSVWDVHAACLGNVLSVALTTVITTIVKVMVGRPRPDLLDRCQPSSSASNGIPYGLVTSAICTTADMSRLREGFRSFPSGHSSTAFAGLGFFGFYLAGKMHLFDQRGHAIKAWIALVPFMGAATITLTRTMDYRHHATDVIAGSLLGLLTAHFSYRIYYPPLNHLMAHKPYAPRIPEVVDYDSEQHGVDIEDAYDDGSPEGPEGTLKRPDNGSGQGPPGIALQGQVQGIGGSGSLRGTNRGYADLESGR